MFSLLSLLSLLQLRLPQLSRLPPALKLQLPLVVLLLFSCWFDAQPIAKVLALCRPTRLC